MTSRRPPNLFPFVGCIAVNGKAKFAFYFPLFWVVVPVNFFGIVRPLGELFRALLPILWEGVIFRPGDGDLFRFVSGAVPLYMPLFPALAADDVRVGT